MWTVEALNQANSGAYNGRSAAGTFGSVAGHSAYASTTTRTSGRFHTTLGRLVAPPTRRTGPGLVGWALFGISAAVFGWATLSGKPVSWGAVLIVGMVALRVSKAWRASAAKSRNERSLAIWRRFLVCVPCNTAFLSAAETRQLGLGVHGWRVPVEGLRATVTRLAAQGR